VDLAVVARALLDLRVIPELQILAVVAGALQVLRGQLAVLAVLVLLYFVMQTVIQPQQVQQVLPQLPYPVVTEYINLQHPVQ